MSIIIKAIQKINSNAKVSVLDGDIEKITWLDGTTPISKEDIETQIPIVEQEIADEIQAKIDLKASAKTKLMAGEALTEDEANVMIGG